MSLTPAQTRSLRAEAHRLKLKPVVMIGQNGLSENVIKELDQALSHHELIKIRIPALDKKDKNEMIEQICETCGGEPVQQIGHVLVLFRANPKQQRFAKLLKSAAP